MITLPNDLVEGNIKLQKKKKSDRPILLVLLLKLVTCKISTNYCNTSSLSLRLRKSHQFKNKLIGGSTEIRHIPRKKWMSNGQLSFSGLNGNTLINLFTRGINVYLQYTYFYVSNHAMILDNRPY